MDIKELKYKAIKGSFWSVIEKFSLQIVQFIVGIILARLLGPEEFGLVAMTSIFLAISQAISDGGFEKALIQRKELSNIQINTAFYVNIIVSLGMAAIVCLLAPHIAVFFREPQVEKILYVMSIGLPLEALGQTQRTLLIKELHFKKISIAQIICSLVTGVVGIVMAYSDFGVWSLVISSLVGTCTWVIIYWIKSSWYPKFVFSYSSISSLLPFGLNVLARSILSYVMYQFNNIIIGKFYSKGVLGLFNRGMRFPEMVTGIIQGIILKMSFPLFAKVQDNEDHLRKVYYKTNRMIAFIEFPLMAFLFIDAKEIVLFLLTDKWLGCVIFLKMFCIIKLIEPFISVQCELLLSKGKAKLLFLLSIIASLMEIIPVLLLVRFGVLYIVWVSLVCKIAQYIMYHFVIARKIKIRFKESLEYISYYSLVVIAVIGVVGIIRWALYDGEEVSLFLKLILDFTLGFATYTLINWRIKSEEIGVIKGMLPFMKKSVQ